MPSVSGGSEYGVAQAEKSRPTRSSVRTRMGFERSRDLSCGSSLALKQAEENASDLLLCRLIGCFDEGALPELGGLSPEAVLLVEDREVTQRLEAARVEVDRHLE